MSKTTLIVLAILFPPIAVFLHKGVGLDVLVNVVLTCLFFVPGVVHALWVVTKK